MEIKPPCETNKVSSAMSCIYCRYYVTHVAVVVAAHRVSRAGVAASDADDVDRGAGQPDERVHVLNDDAEEAQDGRGSSGVSL